MLVDSNLGIYTVLNMLKQVFYFWLEIMVIIVFEFYTTQSFEANTNPIFMGINPWKFGKKTIHYSPIFNSKNYFIPIKIRHKWWEGIDGTQVLWLPWFSAKNNTCLKIWNAGYLCCRLKTFTENWDSNRHLLELSYPI